MNVLFSADLEGDFTRLFQLARQADICICCGDIFNYHQLPSPEFEFPLPFFSVKGNKELWGRERLQQALEKCYNFFWLNQHLDRLEELTGLRFFGIDYIHEPLTIPNNIDILVSHQPAYGLADRCSDPFRGERIPHCGSRLLRRLVDQYQPRYIIAGHVHVFQEQRGTNTVAITLGYALNDPILMLKGKELTVNNLIQ
ncbi:MAG: metallophosphoesterase [Promethearchaeota archaeon]